MAMMYEGFDCKVTVATNTEQALSEVTHGSVDVVIAGYRFVRAHGVQLRDTIKAVRPGLCIATICDPADRLPEHHQVVDVYLRPTLFFTDLRQCRNILSGCYTATP
jgi:hypothetical protein